MRYDPQADNAELMRLYNQEVKVSPQLPDKETIRLRARLVFEEAMEFVTACGCRVDIPMEDGAKPSVELDDKIKPSLIEYADACGDILVVTYGALNAAGIHAVPLWDEIQRSNMSKVFPDGKIHKREDGKVLKPDTYSPADIPTVLKRCESMNAVDRLTDLYPEIKTVASQGQNIWSWMATEAYGVPYKFTYTMAEQAKDIGDVGVFSRVILARKAVKILVARFPRELSPERLARVLDTTSAIADELLTLFQERFPKVTPPRPKEKK